MKKTLSGPVHKWKIGLDSRLFGKLVLPFGEARELFAAVPFNAETGNGEQRCSSGPHIKKLSRVMRDGLYTPAEFTISLRDNHKNQAQFDLVDGVEHFSIEVDYDDPLPVSDGEHRLAGLELLKKEFAAELAKADDPDKVNWESLIDDVLNVPISFTLLLDGTAKVDFVNLQEGRPVDKAHMASMRVCLGGTPPDVKTAFATAPLLNQHADSPFREKIRLDSRGMLPLPVSSLCSKGASDLATSLVGLARVGGKQGAEELCKRVCETFRFLKKNAKELMDFGKVLTPISDGGKKGGATLTVGVAVVWAYRLAALGRPTEPTDEDFQRLLQSAKFCLDERVQGDFAGPAKRKLIGRFAQDFLSDVVDDFHEKLPVSLLKLLSPSAFGVGKLPRPPAKKRTRKKAGAAS